VGGSKAVAAGGVVLAVLGALTACAASGPSAPGSAATTTSSTAAASASVGALSALRSVPDTVANRGSIVVNNVSAIWSAAGLPATPSGTEAASKTGQNATTQVYEGSPAGTILWRLAPNDPAPLGYPTLSVRQEIMIGPIVDQVSEVWAPVSATAVAAAVHPLRPGTEQAGAGVLYDLGPRVNPNRPVPFNLLLLGTRYLLVPSSGGRIITGSISMPQSTLTALATGARVAHSLAADPAVSAVIGALGPKFQTLTMGTYSPTPTEIFAHATPAMLERMNRMTGLGQLRHGPLMTGFAYTGGPLTAQTVVAAALYPSAADARSAADITARYATDGTSLRFGRPYTTLWRVNKTSVRGSLVVMNLTTMFPGSVTQAYMSNDFPLFWSPA
jgi:hypothetical protein